MSHQARRKAAKERLALEKDWLLAGVGLAARPRRSAIGERSFSADY
jgi:hypothetical protein